MSTPTTPNEFAAMANTDETNPTPTPNDWRTDAELRQIERQMIREENNPAGFAAFCHSVLQGDIIDDATRALILLGGVINGLRRIKPCDKDTVRRLFEESRQAIDVLPDGPRKSRLDSLWDYNVGIFARENGEYNLAAQSQESGAKKAEQAGNREGAAICAFTATVEWVNHALVTGQGLAQAIQRLLNPQNNLAAVPPSSNEYHWVIFNAPVHRITATFWAGVNYNQLEADIQTLHQLPQTNPKLAQAQTATIVVCSAINFLAKENWTEAHNLVQNIIDGPTDKIHPDYLATAHLVLARIAFLQNRQEEAKHHLLDIINLPLEGAYQVRAIAQRELAAWPVS